MMRLKACYHAKSLTSKRDTTPMHLTSKLKLKSKLKARKFWQMMEERNTARKAHATQCIQRAVLRGRREQVQVHRRPTGEEGAPGRGGDAAAVAQRDGGGSGGDAGASHATLPILAPVRAASRAPHLTATFPRAGATANSWSSIGAARRGCGAAPAAEERERR